MANTWDTLTPDQQKAIRGWLSARGIDQSKQVEVSTSGDTLVVPAR